MGAHGEFAHTEKQKAIMKLIIAAADSGGAINFTDLRDRLLYKPSKQAVLCSLQFLQNHGMLTKEMRGSRPMLLHPTEKARLTFVGRATIEVEP